MELSIEQIKQILENCIDGECHGACPLFLESQYCIDILAPNVLKVIKELEDWKAIAEGYQKQFEDCAEDRAKLTEENERLRAHIQEGIDLANQIPTMVLETARTTVEKMCSEFKRRCTEGGIYPAFVARTIDQIAKEMLEGEK